MHGGGGRRLPWLVLRPPTKQQMLDGWTKRQRVVLRQSPQMRMTAQLGATLITILGLFLLGLAVVQQLGDEAPPSWPDTVLACVTCWLAAVGFLVVESRQCVRIDSQGLRESHFPVGRDRLVAWGEVDHFEIQSVLTMHMVYAVLVSGYAHSFDALEVSWTEQKTGKAWRSYQEDAVDVLNEILEEVKARPGFTVVVADRRALRRRAIIGLAVTVVCIIAFYTAMFMWVAA